MSQPQISLEQWRVLIAVIEAGGYAQAAGRLYKSQSAVTYAVQKIEAMLQVQVFELQGRRAVLTPTGQMLYRRALMLVEEANNLEHAARTLSAGWEPVIGIAAEILFPTTTLLTCLDRFGYESPGTRVELVESVMGGTPEALLNGEVELAITPQPPTGLLGELLMRVRLLAVAHCDHPLHRMGRELSNRDLRAHRHIVVRDSGAKRDQKAVTVEVDQRWTVGHIATSIRAVRMGYGFAWLPESQIQEDLTSGTLKALPLREGGVREIPLYLVLANPELAGPGVRRLAAILREEAARMQ